jgi:thiamine phosphate synthase YjbQ (UPF0047 family)
MLLNFQLYTLGRFHLFQGVMTTHTYIFVLNGALALNTFPDFVFIILDEMNHCRDCMVMAFDYSSYQFS